MKQNRFRSRLMWIALVAVVGGVVKHYIPGVSDDFQIVTDAAIAVLTIVGVLNNPTDVGKF